MNNLFCTIAVSFLLIAGCAESSNTEDVKPEQPRTENTGDSNSLPGFKATGEAPSWEVAIDFDGDISFKSQDDHSFELSAELSEPVRPQDIDAVSYRTKTKEGRLHLTIFREACSDSTGARNFDHKVRVSAQTNDMNSMVNYEGCGKYLGDYRLNDIWVLESINGQSVDSLKKAPNLEFQLNKNKVYGFGGCNRINGPIEVSEDSLTFGNIAATQMACPNMETEKSFLEQISNKSHHFEIGNLQLTLSNDQSTLIFKKVD